MASSMATHVILLLSCDQVLDEVCVSHPFHDTRRTPRASPISPLEPNCSRGAFIQPLLRLSCHAPRAQEAYHQVCNCRIATMPVQEEMSTTPHHTTPHHTNPIFACDQVTDSCTMLLVRRLSRGRSGFARTTRTHSVAPAASSTIRSYSVTTESSPGLRIGVVGLGAIGTIFFAKLARLAAAPPPDSTLPRVCSVDAFVRPQQLMAWVNEESLSPRVKLAPSSGSTSKDGQVDLRFHSATDSKELMATAENAPSVRVRALELLQGDAVVESDRIDVVLVAVKAYDSAETIHELQRAEYANLFKRDVLCVLLQNGLGEGLPSHESGPNGAAQNNRSDWQFANGVTFIGGRVTAFGSVATSGVETGATYLAPIGDARACSDKVDAVVNVLQAAGKLSEEPDSCCGR